MSQAVHIDMEVLQRIKFLMEYDIMKTSSENVLTEQIEASKVPNLSKQLTVTGRNKDMMAMGLDSKDPSDVKKYEKLSKNAYWPISQSIELSKTDPALGVPKTLEELTAEVREFMSDWKVASVEAIMTYVGVGIPVVLTANGLWMILEIIQAAKGTPDWWSLVFSILATLTAGTQALWLKPLYKLGGKGAKNLFEALDLLYKYAKSMTGGSGLFGFGDDLISLIKTIPQQLPKLLNILDEGIKWITKWNAKWGQKTADGTVKAVESLTIARSWLSKQIESFGKWVTKVMDKPLYKMGRQAGLNPDTSKKLGGAVRWGSVPVGIAGGVKGAEYFFGQPTLDSIPSRKLPSGSYLPPDLR
jgi:hypothetical protein